MIVYLWVTIALQALALITLPFTIGRERKPITASYAAGASMMSLALIVFATVALLRGWAV